MSKPSLVLAVILFVSLALRLFSLGTPVFNDEEARISARAHQLVQTGSDELGRQYPLVFNSHTDYQLPLTSYFTAIGTGLFGKNDFGARVGFILLAGLLVYLTFLLSKKLGFNSATSLLAALVISLSPVLLFFSKVPNDSLLMAVFVTAIMLWLPLNKKSIPLILGLIIGALLTNKFLWFVLPALALVSLYDSKQLKIRSSQLFFVGILILVGVFFVIFLSIPQSWRSLSENNLPLLVDDSMISGVNALRGEGLLSGWPNSIEKVLFNKLVLIPVGLLGWTSTFNLANFFGSLPFWPLTFLIPLAFGVVQLIRKENTKAKSIGLVTVALTLPMLFAYPNQPTELLFVLLPLGSIIIGYGLVSLPRKLLALILIVGLLEFMIHSSFIATDNRTDHHLRPSWMAGVVIDAKAVPGVQEVYLSENITEDPQPFLHWYGDLNGVVPTAELQHPYRYFVTDFGRLKLQDTREHLSYCNRLGTDRVYFLSANDYEQNRDRERAVIIKAYTDSENKPHAYQVYVNCEGGDE